MIKEDSLLSSGFKEGLFIGVGDGKNTRSWKDPWVGADSLSAKFSRIFAMSTNKVPLIDDVGLFAH